MPTRPTVVIVSCLALGCFGGGFLALRSCARACFDDGATNDLTLYEARVEQWKKQVAESVAHFPAKIPADGQDVRFAARNRVMQAAGYIQLHLKLSTQEIQNIEAQLKKTIQPRANGIFFDPQYKTEKVFLPECGLFVGGQAGEGAGRHFPENFTLYLISPKGNEVHLMNDATWGVAISPSTNEVIYWVEVWS